MLDELNTAIEAYHAKWHQLVAGRTDQDFFTKLTPTAVGWKAEDLADLDQRVESLRALCDQIHWGWVNQRWLVTLHLKGQPLACGVTLIKLMQRRPNSTDPTGLDHLDFLTPNKDAAKKVLAAEPELKWTEEQNNLHCSWLSLWFGGTEAKIRDNTVVSVCAAELNVVEATIVKSNA